MTCSERAELIYLHVAGVLEEGERAELDAHLASGCPRCNDALDEAREELADLVLTLAPIAPPARVRERLLARAREQAPRSLLTARYTPLALRWGSVGRRLAPYAAVALAALALGLGIGWWRLAQPLARERAALVADRASLEAAREAAAVELEALRVERDQQDRELAELETQGERAAEVSDLLSARELDVMELAASEPRGDAWGRAFWDRDDYRCYFRAHGLAPLTSGSRYVLWMTGAGERVHAAGALEPDPNGDVVFFTRLPQELSPIAKSFVTAEATPHGERPTGPTLLLGEARRD